MHVSSELIVQIKQKGVYGIETPLPRSFSGGLSLSDSLYCSCFYSLILSHACAPPHSLPARSPLSSVNSKICMCLVSTGCLCVCDRERDGERERMRESTCGVCACVCVHVCVCARACVHAIDMKKAQMVCACAQMYTHTRKKKAPRRMIGRGGGGGRASPKKKTHKK